MKIAFIWRGELQYRNKCRYQRVLCLAQHHNLTLFVRRDAYVASEIQGNLGALCRVPFGFWRRYWDYLALSLYAIVKVLLARGPDSYKVVYTPPDHTLVLGFLLKVLSLGRVKWIADIWDNPVLIETADSRTKQWLVAAFTWIIRFSLRYVDLAIVAVLPETLQHYQITPDKWVIVTNGVALHMFDPTLYSATTTEDGCWSILYVGHIVPERGIDTLLASIRLAKAYGISNLRLHLVGFSDERSETWLRAQIRELDIAPNVRYWGAVSAERVPEMIAGANVCVHPFPRREGLDEIYPIKIYEYLAMGKPVVSSDLQGVRRIIKDRWNGLLVEPSNPEAMAQAIVRLYSDSALRMQLERNARSSVAAFDWSKINERIIEALARFEKDSYLLGR